LKEARERKNAVVDFATGPEKIENFWGLSLTSGGRGTKLNASPSMTSTTGPGIAGLSATTANAANRRTMISA
jgi:hypothetical protein